jgi:hypothetical protein
MSQLNGHCVLGDRGRNQRARWLRTALCLLGCVNGAVLSAQTQMPRALTLLEALDLARRNYPSVKEVRARADAAKENVDVARTSYLPRLDVLWQGNRATRNNVFGLLLPQSIVPPMERTFVIRVKVGVAEWVNVGRGARVGDLIEVFGPLKDGDAIVRRGTDEIREGTKLEIAPTKSS